MHRSTIVLLSLLSITACNAENALDAPSDQADQQGPKRPKTTCSASRLVVGGTPQQIPLEVRRQDEGNEFARTVFRVEDQDAFPYFLEASIEDANPDSVLVIFRDLDTDVASSAQGNFGTDPLDAKAGERFDWGEDQVKDGTQEFVSMSCCRNTSGTCSVDFQ